MDVVCVEHFMRMTLSVTWDKATLGTKPKELCPDPPMAAGRVRHRIRVSTVYKLC
jgi:hypothetical protein